MMYRIGQLILMTTVALVASCAHPVAPAAGEVYFGQGYDAAALASVNDPSDIELVIPDVRRHTRGLAADLSDVAVSRAPILAVAVQGTRSCSVVVGEMELGATPVEVAVPEGKHRVVVKCGKRQLYAANLAFAKGAEQRLDLSPSKRKKKRRSGKRLRR